MGDVARALFAPNWVPLAASFLVLAVGIVMVRREMRRERAGRRRLQPGDILIKGNPDGSWTCSHCPGWEPQGTVAEVKPLLYEHILTAHTSEGSN